MSGFFSYKIIEQGIKYKFFKKFTENREKADCSIVFHQIFGVSFVDWNCTAFFQSSGNTPYPNIDRNISFNGKAIVLLHSLIIIIDILSHP